MARYRKIDPRIWNDRKFLSLHDDGKLVFLFLLTHPHMTALGAMRANTHGLAAELGWSHSRFHKAFQQALQEGMIDYDEKASCLVVPNFLKYNGPESPNVVKAWASALDLIPECGLKTTLLTRVKGFVEGLHEGFQKALPQGFAEAIGKAMPIQEQEQEQKPEQEQEIPPLSPKGEKVGLSFDRDFWLHYPRHEDKETARSAWGRLSKRDKAAAVEGMHRLKTTEQWRKDSGQFVPYASKFLNKKRWRDQPTDYSTNGHAEIGKSKFPTKKFTQEEIAAAIPIVKQVMAEVKGLPIKKLMKKKTALMEKYFEEQGIKYDSRLCAIAMEAGRTEPQAQD